MSIFISDPITLKAIISVGVGWWFAAFLLFLANVLDITMSCTIGQDEAKYEKEIKGGFLISFIVFVLGGLLIIYGLFGLMVM